MSFGFGLGFPRNRPFAGGPSLDFQFAGSTTLDPQITFTRASSATMFDSSGTLVYAPMNLLLWSEDFSQAAWTRQASVSVSTDTTVAPDGTTTADTITGNSGFGVFQQLAVTAGQRVTQSVYLKAGTATAVMFRDDTGAGRHIVVNPTTGVITSTSGTLIDFGSISMGNGWYRLYFSYTADSTVVRGIVRPDSAGAGQTFILWGAQTNFYPMQGGVTGSLSTYYPTTSAAYQGPRLDYDPATLLPRGFLVEEQRTNLVLQSQDFATTWTQTASPIVTTNTSVAPDGTTTADTIAATATGSYVAQIITFTGDGTKAYSFFIKAGTSGNTRVFIRDTIASASRGQVDIVWTGGVPSPTVTNGSLQSLQACPNGWYRVSVIADSVVAANTNQFRIQPDNVSGTGSIIIWGFQAENAAFSTSYIPTTTTALTRSADVAAVNTLTPWFNGTEGTLFVRAAIGSAAATTIRLAAIDDGATGNVIRYAGGTVSFQVLNSGSTQANLGLGTLTDNVAASLAGAYKVNDFAASINGGAVVTDNSGTIPTVDRLILGAASVVSPRQTWIQRLTYYPRRLSNAELQAITA